MIRSSTHTIKFANTQKRENYTAFIKEYRRVSKIILDMIWDKGYDKFSIQNDSLDLPKYLDYNQFRSETKLTARALSSLTTQLRGIISASTEKRRRLLWLKNKLTQEDKTVKHVEKRIHQTKITKPDVSRINPELSSKCSDLAIIKDSSSEFDYFLRLKATGFGMIKLPLKSYSQAEKWRQSGKLLTSFLLKDKEICLRYEIPKNNQEKPDNIIGIDQGLNAVATLSDGQFTPTQDAHGHSLKSIINKLSRKKKGSRAFKRAQSHRKNFIHWSINQLNLNAKEVRLEKIVNMGFGKTKGRKISHWTNTLIRDKIIARCEELEVPVLEQDCSYRSQRCFKCGMVKKSNRKGLIYKCSCGYTANADYNAALNHSIDLPAIPFDFKSTFSKLPPKKRVFYWNENSEFRVPNAEKE